MNPSIFIGIGAQRAGSTWLASYLDAHPQVAFSPIKELHFFDRGKAIGVWSEKDLKFLKQLRVSIRRLEGAPDEAAMNRVEALLRRLKMALGSCSYLEYFNALSTNETVVAGEFTPAYATLSAVDFEEMRRCAGSAKLIFVLRDPVCRVWSHLRFLETTCKNGAFDAVSAASSCLDNPALIARTQYEKTLDAAERVFSADNVLVLFFEHLFDERYSRDELRRLTEFLGISPREGDIDSLSNQSVRRAMPDSLESAVRKRFSSTYQSIADRFGERIPALWLEH